MPTGLHRCPTLCWAPMAQNAVANILRNLAKPFKPEPRAILVQRLAAAIERIADQVDRARLRTRRTGALATVVTGIVGHSDYFMHNLVFGRSSSEGGWASMRPPGSDHNHRPPGPNPLRSISTPSASRAERMALGVNPRSCATRLSSAAATGSPTNAARRNSIASALAVRVLFPTVSALVIVTNGVGTPSCSRPSRPYPGRLRSCNNITRSARTLLTGGQDAAGFRPRRRDAGRWCAVDADDAAARAEAREPRDDGRGSPRRSSGETAVGPRARRASDRSIRREAARSVARSAGASCGRPCNAASSSPSSAARAAACSLAAIPAAADRRVGIA